MKSSETFEPQWLPCLQWLLGKPHSTSKTRCQKNQKLAFCSQHAFLRGKLEKQIWKFGETRVFPKCWMGWLVLGRYFVSYHIHLDHHWSLSPIWISFEQIHTDSIQFHPQKTCVHSPKTNRNTVTWKYIDPLKRRFRFRTWKCHLLFWIHVGLRWVRKC